MKDMKLHKKRWRQNRKMQKRGERFMKLKGFEEYKKEARSVQKLTQKSAIFLHLMQRDKVWREQAM